MRTDSTNLEALLAAARRHGEESEPAMETGDLEDILRFAWPRLSPEDQRAVCGRFGHLLEEWPGPEARA